MPDTSRLQDEIRSRSTTDLLILLIAGTVCFAILATGALIAATKLLHPSSDTSAAEAALTDVINTMIGLMAGFVAGRTQTNMPTHPTPKENPDAAPRPGDQ